MGANHFPSHSPATHAISTHAPGLPVSDLMQAYPLFECNSYAVV